MSAIWFLNLCKDRLKGEFPVSLTVYSGRNVFAFYVFQDCISIFPKIFMCDLEDLVTLIDITLWLGIPLVMKLIRNLIFSARY